MPYEDMREFIKKLEDEGELVRVKAKVDWNLELGAVAQKSAHSNGPALLFENIKDYSGHKIFLNGLLTPRRLAILLGMPLDSSMQDVCKEIARRFRTPVKPRIVKSGPCKENVKSAEVDLFQFPTPKWFYLDGHRYIGTWHCVITKDPDTGVRNIGVYRLGIHDKSSTGIYVQFHQHIGFHFLKYMERNEPMPLAVAIGQDEVNPLLACQGHPYGIVDEWDKWNLMGALRKEPVELVKCETVDLEVPATAEIVLEGEVDPKERRAEGPFSEYPGYWGETKMHMFPVFRVKCVTYRDDPVFRGIIVAKPPSECSRVCTVGRVTATLRELEKLGRDDVIDVAQPWESCNEDMMIVSIEKRYAGHAYDIAQLIFGLQTARYTKNMIVVDKDIDPWSLTEVVWAFNTRVQASRQIRIIPNSWGSLIDPSQSFAKRGVSDRLIVDATWPIKPEDDFPPREEWGGRYYPPTAIPDGETRKLVEKRWKEYGIP